MGQFRVSKSPPARSVSERSAHTSLAARSTLYCQTSPQPISDSIPAENIPVKLVSIRSQAGVTAAGGLARRIRTIPHTLQHRVQYARELLPDAPDIAGATRHSIVDHQLTCGRTLALASVCPIEVAPWYYKSVCYCRNEAGLQRQPERTIPDTWRRRPNAVKSELQSVGPELAHEVRRDSATATVWAPRFFMGAW